MLRIRRFHRFGPERQPRPPHDAARTTPQEGALSGESGVEVRSHLKEGTAPSPEGFPILTASGGKTKYELLKKLYVPYGERLYVSHDIVSDSLDIGALIAAVAAVCGPKGVALAAGLAVGLAALKLMDRGNGIIITRIPFGTGPCVPTPQ